MKRNLLSIVAGGLLVVGGAMAQSTSTPSGAVPPSTYPGGAVPPHNEGPTPKQQGERHKARVENQRQRIKDGVKTGQLTPDQAKALGRNEGRINAEARGMEAKNGGQLTAVQSARITHQMNNESRAISKAKH